MALYQRIKRQFLSRVKLVRVALGLALIGAVMAIWILVVKPLTPTVNLVWQAMNASLPNKNGRTNILILGREGSSSRAGADLTDTLILASIDQGGDTVLISIPRDIWVSSLRAKINTAYYYGEQRQPGGGGLVLARAAVEEIIDQPAHYTVVIDFAGFEKVIDLLGGVDINVDRGFVDKEFPIPGKENDECDGDPLFKCRYETVEFKPGLQHMDGATALKFVRSRHAEGDEGTDFARSQRQEKLILALKAKLLSRQVMFNLRLWDQLYKQINQVVVTDITPSQYLPLARLALKSLKLPTRTGALVEPDWVYHPPVTSAQDYQWVLLPAEGLQSHVEDLLVVPAQN